MKYLLFFAALLMPVFLASCFEDSTVIKVGKDGSGIVHHREYQATHSKEEDVTLPDEAELKAEAERMGATFESCKIAKNPKGWFGYEVVYTFDDINDLVVRPDGKKEDGEEGEGEFAIRFEMKEGVLEARMEDSGWAEAEEQEAVQDGPTIDPYADTTGPPAAKVDIASGALDVDGEMWKKMSKGMRVGIFLQIDDPLVETNATYRNGSLFTLLNADFEKMTASGKMESLEQLEAPSRERMEQLVEEIDGFEMDLQQPVRFVFE